MKRLPLITLALLAALAVACSALAAATAATPIPGVRSPTGNIRCLFVPPVGGGTEPPNLICSIAEANYSAALQHQCVDGPAGLDWHGFELPAKQKGNVLCAGGIMYDPAHQRPAYATLPYNATWRHGTYSCVSRRTGLTCVTGLGHGLFISRESWRAW